MRRGSARRLVRGWAQRAGSDALGDERAGLDRDVGLEAGAAGRVGW